jgi:UDP-N-acetylmuramyl pentapeptide phosphotransferase/UDP-N-acetylglucosamine-1-phosphate transferase
MRVSRQERSVEDELERYLSRVAEVRRRFPRVVLVPGLELTNTTDPAAVRTLPLPGHAREGGFTLQSAVDALPVLLRALAVTLLVRRRPARVCDARDYDERDDRAPRFNAKLSDLAAALGRSQLPRVDAFVARRRAIAARYRARLRGARCALPVEAGARHVYHRFVVEVERPPDAVQAMLAARLDWAYLAAVAAAMAYGVILSVVPHWLPGALWINIALTLLWFLTVTNAVQFLDGMDGLAAGLGVTAGLFFSISALQTGQPYLFILAAPLVGACLGFLPYSFRRHGAQIFLGDADASFIGFTLAGLAVMGEWAEDDPIVALLTPILILAVPLFDIAFVGVVRVTTGKVHSLREWLTYMAKDHIHHRFGALGLSKTQSVLLILFIAGTLGLSALQLKQATPREAAVILIQGGCVLAIIAILERVGRGRARRS